MRVIDLTGLIDAYGGAVSAQVTLRAEAMRAQSPAIRMGGSSITFPQTLRAVFSSGKWDSPLELDTLPLDCYWNLTVSAAGSARSVTRNVQFPAGNGPLAFENLVDVSPASAAPSADALASWAAAVQQVQGLLDVVNSQTLAATDAATEAEKSLADTQEFIVGVPELLSAVTEAADAATSSAEAATQRAAEATASAQLAVQGEADATFSAQLAADMAAEAEADRTATDQAVGTTAQKAAEALSSAQLASQKASDAQAALAAASAASKVASDKATEALSSAQLAAQRAADAETARLAAITASATVDTKIAAISQWGDTTRLAPLARIVKASTGAFRVLVGGTSIAEDSRSSTRMIIEQLKNAYGDSNIYTARGGFLGGSTANAAINGWAKQPFGGALFTRIRGASTSTTLLATGGGYSDEVVVYWSQEADSGVCDVLIDGVIVGQIGSAGPQAYRKSTTFTVPLGAHTIAFNPPTSGYIYLEDVEFRLTARKGVEAVYAALGGSMLRDMRVLHPLAANQVAGIPVEGMSGVDSISARANVDVAVYQWLVNDTGFNQSDNFTQHYKPAFDQIVANHLALGTPMVVIIEMGGHYSMPNDAGSNANNTRFNQFRNYLLSLRSYAHVTVIDWHAATIDTDLARYAARYYSATSVNVAAGTYGGDFIHPNEAGHAVLHALLAEAFGLTPPKRVAPSEVALERARALPAGRGIDKVATIGGVAARYAAPSGGALAALSTGASSAYQSVLVPFYRNAAASNDRVSSILAEIAASANSTEYGKYVDYNLKALGMGTFFGTDKAAFTVKASGNLTIRCDGVLTIYTPDGFPLPKDSNGRTYLQYTLAGTEPLVYTCILGSTSSNATMYLSGRVYDIGLSKADVPLLPA